MLRVAGPPPWRVQLAVTRSPGPCDVQACCDIPVTGTCIYLPGAFSKEWVLILETSNHSHSEPSHV